ncbi:MAG: hypothetical protein ACJAYB_001483 [Psychromonas sp.]|jgi:hypothetical protein
MQNPHDLIASKNAGMGIGFSCQYYITAGTDIENEVIHCPVA